LACQMYSRSCSIRTVIYPRVGEPSLTYISVDSCRQASILPYEVHSVSHVSQAHQIFPPLPRNPLLRRSQWGSLAVRFYSTLLNLDCSDSGWRLERFLGILSRHPQRRMPQCVRCLGGSNVFGEPSCRSKRGHSQGSLCLGNGGHSQITLTSAALSLQPVR
jgi:hypothetical protein